MRNLVAKEGVGYTVGEHKTLNRKDHRLRIQRGVHPLLSTDMLVNADYQRGVITQAEFERRRRIIGEKIRKRGIISLCLRPR